MELFVGQLNLNCLQNWTPIYKYGEPEQRIDLMNSGSFWDQEI